MKRCARFAIAFLASAEGAEVFSGLWDDIVVLSEVSEGVVVD